MSGTGRVPQREAFGEALAELGAERPRMHVLDPGVCTSTRTALFSDAFPERFHAMGIAEANAVCAAAGIASCGLEPRVSAFAVFLASRAADQVRVSVVHAALPVRLNGAYGGLPSGRGGATHSSIDDLAVMRLLSGMTVLSPADASEARTMARLAMGVPGPVYLRTVRCEVPDLFGPDWKPTFGQAVELAPGDDVAILTEGMMGSRALTAARLLAADGVRARVLHFGTVKPLDHGAVVRAARECGAVVTVENHSRLGGFGASVAEALVEKAPCRARLLGFPDVFLESGDDDLVFAKHGLDAAGIARSVRDLLSGPGARMEV